MLLQKEFKEFLVAFTKVGSSDGTAAVFVIFSVCTLTIEASEVSNTADEEIIGVLLIVAKEEDVNCGM